MSSVTSTDMLLVGGFAQSTGPFDVAARISTPIGLAALALLVMSAAFLAIIQKDPKGAQVGLMRSMIRYSSITGMVLGLISITGTFVLPYLNAQQNSVMRVSGVVLSDDGEPVSYVKVAIVGGSSQDTNERGEFEIPLLRSLFGDGYTVVVYDPEYKKYIKEIKVDLTKPLVINLEKKQFKSDIFGDLVELYVGHYVGSPYLAPSFTVTNSNPFSLKMGPIGGTLISPKSINTDLLFLSVAFSDPPPENDGWRLRPSKQLQLKGYFWNSATVLTVFGQRVADEIKLKPINMSPYIAEDRLSMDLVKALQVYAANHFAWYPGTWKLKLSTKIDGKPGSRTYQFDLS